MKRFFRRLGVLAALLAVLGGCKTLSTNLSIPQQRIPLSYQQEHADSANIARIEWRQYFSDSTLLQLIDTALANSMDLQVAFQRVEASRWLVKGASGAMLPQVSADISGGVSRFGLYTSDGAGNANSEIAPGKQTPKHLPDYRIGLTSTWEVAAWGKLRNQRKAAVARYLSTAEGVNLVVTSLIADVAEAYYELLALDNELDIIRQAAAKNEEALEIAVIQKQVGRANELAVQQLKVQQIESQVMEKEKQQQRVETENRLNFLLGRFPKPIACCKEMLFSELPHQIAVGLPMQLLLNRPDIREAELQVKAAQFDLKAARAAFFPSLNISASYGLNAYSMGYLFKSPASLAYSILGGLSLPLMNRSALKAEFGIAKSNQLEAMYVYQKTILNGYIEVVNQLSNIDMLRQVGSLKKQECMAINQSIETSIDLFKTAKASYLDVLMAQQNALNANLEMISTYKQQRIAAVGMYKALGGGWK